MSNENGNGHGDYNPVVFYRYLDADVWVKEDVNTGTETVVYTEDVVGDLFDDSTDNIDQDDNN